MRQYAAFFIVFTIIFLTNTIEVYSQLIIADTISISGVVLESDSLTSLPNVHITSHKNTGTVTNLSGQFAFLANANDTLTFSYIGFKDFVFVIPDTLKFNSYVFGAILNKDTIMLSEVIILPWMNKKQFKNAFINNQPDRNTVNATRNLNLMKYTAKAYSPSWTSNRKVDFQIKSSAQSVEYKGMIPPDQSLNIIGFVQYLIFFTHQQLTKEEKERRLREELRHYILEEHP